MSRFLILLCSDILSIATGWGFFCCGVGGGGRRLASGVKLQQKCKSSFMYVLCNLYNFICFMHVFFVCTMIFIIHVLEQYIINGQTIGF